MSRDRDERPAVPVSTHELVRRLSRLQAEAEGLRAEIEELREAQGMLEGSRDDFVELHDLAPVVLLTLGKDGTIRSANLAAAELFEEERGALIQRPLRSFVHEQDRLRVAEHLAERSKGLRRGCEVRLVLSNGSVAPVQLWARASWRRPGVQHLTLLDLRERELDAWEKRQLVDVARRARAAVDSKDQFIAMLSHELRTPLTPVLAAASALRDTPNVSPKLRDLFSIIERNVAAEARLIDDLLDATGIVRGRLRVELEPLDLHALVQECVDAIKPQAERKGVSLSFVPAAAESWTRGDALRLSQVVSNLLTNAIKFTPPGGQICLRSWNNGDRVALEVQDDGVGFDPNRTEALFTAFEKLDGTAEHHGTGLGLGLAICKGLVELHAGQITAGSPGPNRGARFVVELPAVAAVPAPPPRPRRTASGTLESGVVPRHRILVIEDHADTAAMLAVLLRERGYQVVLACSVDEAKAVDLARIDAIISDIGLPDGSGLDLLRHLPRTPDQPAIALSGYGMPLDLRRSKQAGFDLHLVKPIDFEQLFDKLAELLTRRAAKNGVQGGDELVDVNRLGEV